jgi:hypothetical protein
VHVHLLSLSEAGLVSGRVGTQHGALFTLHRALSEPVSVLGLRRSLKNQRFLGTDASGVRL